MKLLGLLIIASLSIYAMMKGKPSASAAPSKGMEAALNNANNQQGYQIGKAEDFEKSIQRFRNMSREELKNIIEREALNLYEVSNALLVLSNHYIEMADMETTINLLTTLTDDYHNPMAMVTLARLNFKGYEEEPGGTVPIIVRDLEKAFYLINRAFETAGLMHSKTGEKYALDRCVANGLGLLDSYQLSDVRKEFNYETKAARINQSIQEDLAAFMKMYKL